MKANIVIVCTALLVTLEAKTDPACITNSYNLTQQYDYKNYHSADDCTCPCGKLRDEKIVANNRNQCTKCGHYHDATSPLIAKPWQIEQRTAAPALPTQQYDPKIMKGLIQRYAKETSNK